MRKTLAALLLASVLMVSAETLLFDETLSSLSFSPSPNCWKRTDYVDKVVYEFKGENKWGILEVPCSNSPSSVNFITGTGLSATSEDVDVVDVEATRVTLTGDISFLESDTQEFDWWVEVPTFEILVETTAAPGCDEQGILFDSREYLKVIGLIAYIDDCESNLRVRQEPTGAKTIVYVSFDAKEINTKEKSRFGGLYYYASKDALGNPKKKYRVAKEFKFVYDFQPRSEEEVKKALCSADGFDLGGEGSELAALGVSMVIKPGFPSIKRSDYELFPECGFTVDPGFEFNAGKASITTSAGYVGEVTLTALSTPILEDIARAYGIDGGVGGGVLKSAVKLSSASTEKAIWAVDGSELSPGRYTYELEFKDSKGEPLEFKDSKGETLEKLVWSKPDEIKEGYANAVQFCVKGAGSSGGFSISSLDTGKGFLAFEASYLPGPEVRKLSATIDYAKKVKVGEEFALKDNKDNENAVFARGQFDDRCKNGECVCNEGELVVTLASAAGPVDKKVAAGEEKTFKGAMQSVSCTLKSDGDGKNSYLWVTGLDEEASYAVVKNGEVVEGSEDVFTPTSGSTLSIEDDYSCSIAGTGACDLLLSVYSSASQSGFKTASLEGDEEEVVVECVEPVSETQLVELDVGEEVGAGNAAMVTANEPESFSVLSYSLADVVTQWECYYYPLVNYVNGGKPYSVWKYDYDSITSGKYVEMNLIDGYGVEYFFKDGLPVTGFPLAWDDSSYGSYIHIYVDPQFSLNRGEIKNDGVSGGFEDYLRGYEAETGSYVVVTEFALERYEPGLWEEVVKNFDELNAGIGKCGVTSGGERESEGCHVFPLTGGTPGAITWNERLFAGEKLPNLVFEETRTLLFPYGQGIAPTTDLYYYLGDLKQFGIPQSMSFAEAISHDSTAKTTVELEGVSVVVKSSKGYPAASIECGYVEEKP